MAEKTLADIPAGKIFQAQQAALMRLQLYLVMRTHEMLREVLSDCREVLGEQYARGGDGQVAGAWDGLSMHLAIEGVTKAWRRGFDEWKGLFERLRFEAAAIPYGTLVVLHREAFRGAGVSGQESVVSGQGTGDSLPHSHTPIPPLSPSPALPLSESTVVFDPQIQAMLDEMRDHVWSDGFNLSQRIWRLDQEGLEGIRRIVYEGVASGDSAWNVAKKLEPFLGAGRDCPRWARSRLYNLTKAEIAGGDRTGLYTGDECMSQGVSYNALRLARNEIQIAHSRLTDYLMARIPWIEKEQVHLSPAHPVTDICDDVIGNGENGEGIYPKGEVLLPLHPQCLCYKSAVMMKPDEFSGQLRGWLEGEEWPEMDAYAGMLGTGRSGIVDQLAMGIADKLVTWLWGKPDDLDGGAG